MIIVAPISTMKEAIERKSIDAEKSNVMMLLPQANGFRKSVKEKEKSNCIITKLQKELKDLTDNLSKLNKIYGGMYHAMQD